MDIFSQFWNLSFQGILTHYYFYVRLQAALPFVVYPIFAAMDLFGTYQGLKHVHLQTLTKVGFVLFNFPQYLEASCVMAQAHCYEILSSLGIPFWASPQGF